MRHSIIMLGIVLLASAQSYADEPPKVVLVDHSQHDGPYGDTYEDLHYLWLSVSRFDDEREDWIEGVAEGQDVLFYLLEMLKDFPEDADDPVKYGAAKRFGLENGQQIPPAVLEEVCSTSMWDEELIERKPDTFVDHARQARGAVLGRITGIDHGFTGLAPALLLTLDVEESLFVSDFSLSPYVVVPAGGYVYDGNVYCGARDRFNGYSPGEGDRIIVMPFTGPWDKDGEIMAVWTSMEFFLVGDPDETGLSEVTPLEKTDGVPKALYEFRDRLWVLRNEQ